MKPYTDYIKRWSPWAVAAALITCIGCSDDLELKSGNSYETTPSDCLAFTTFLAPENSSSATRSSVSNLEIAEEQWALPMARENNCATRGALAKHLDGSAGVLGFQYSQDGIKTPIAGGDNNLEFEFDGDKLVSKSAIILWKTITEPHLNVYAYAPYLSADKANDTDGMKLDFTTAPPQIYYTVPDSISRQKDILVARWVSTEHENPEKPEDYKNKTIPLTFNHILTAICFKVGFACTVKSVAIEGVYNSGMYDLLNGRWENVGSSGSSESSEPSVPSEPSAPSDLSTYTINFSDGIHEYLEVGKDHSLTHEDEYMILMPQTLPDSAKIVLTCVKGNGADENDVEQYTAKIGGQKWEPGRLITYTFYQGNVPGTIYFDLALSDVTIDGSQYKGTVFKNGKDTVISGPHQSGNHYYVYQSTEANRDTIWKGEVCTPPVYDRVKGPDGRPWTEFITDNTDVDAVIEAWDKEHNELLEAVKRKYTENRIAISGNVTCDLTIDNIYSVYQQPWTEKAPDYRTKAGISFVPGSGVSNAKVTIKSVGDNRVGAVHYHNLTNNGNEIIFEGTGSLTVADVDGRKDGDGSSGLESGKGYWSNHWSSAIGNHDSPPGDDACYGIVINSGIIFAGTTKAENCTAIGGGGNATGMVTINGGTVTAVATTTGTAIGGGIGFGSQGGEGHVTITGGNVYAYNHANKWNIPSSAIGGAGSKSSYGAIGNVNIEGGYVYAVSELGTAIGGGSSYSQYGGDANITITGGEVFAKTGSKLSASIGGGTGCSYPQEATNGLPHYGGNATVTIKNSPIIRTGSIGGGGTGDDGSHIGNALIQIYGGDIQAQFLLSAGTGKGEVPSFMMSGGMIRNSNTADTTEYLHVKENGGAVYLENGKVTISGGTIRNCKAKRGGAIYIDGTTKDNAISNALFEMSGGTIEDNEAIRLTGTGTGNSDDNFAGSGGAVYIINGNVTLTGGSIADNLAAGGNGGGIFIRRGSLSVGGNTEIKGNASEIRTTKNTTYAGGNGGGVYVYSHSQVADVSVDLVSGKITGNTADRRGGGLCVIQGSDDRKAIITIGTEGAANDGLPEISGNHCLLQGGGVYAKGAKADIIIYSGAILHNTVSQYVHNQDVANDQGSVTLNGGIVKHNVVTFDANGGSNPPSSQKIVTETNSVLKAPAFTRTGYTLKGWNTKPSGSGVSYTDGQIMNINKDITLYAQWEIGKQ